MNIENFRKAVEEIRKEVGLLDNYVWYFHPVDALRLDKEILMIPKQRSFSEFSQKFLLGFPIEVNDVIPQGMAYFMKKIDNYTGLKIVTFL